MIKNYKTFILENKTLEFKNNIFELDKKKFIFPDDIIKDDIIEFDLSKDLYDVILYTTDNIVDDNRFVNNKFKLLDNNLNFDLKKLHRCFFIEKNSSDYYYIKLNIVKDNIHYEIRISTKTYNEFIYKQNYKQVGDHEQYQILGFYLKDNLIDKNFINRNLKITDFKINNLIVSEQSLNSNKQLILGSALFKKFLNNEFITDNTFNTKILNNKKNFETKTVIHSENLNNFLNSINISENNELSKSFFSHINNFTKNKINTADCVLCNFDYDTKYNDILEKSIIVSSPTNNNNRRYIENWDDICYIIPTDKFLIALNEILLEKEIEDINFYINDTFDEEYYNEIIQRLFDKIDINNTFYHAFVLVSLKKDRFNCQLGKSTLIFKQILDDKNININENVMSDIFDYFSNIVNKFFSIFKKIKDKKVNSIINDINNIKVNNLNENILNNNDFWWSNITSDTVKTYGINNNMVVLSEIKYLSSNVDDIQLKFKINTTYTIDKYINSLINLLGDKFEDLEVFNKKMSLIIGNTLMGNTNLPLYMVYGFNNSVYNPYVTYSLHKMKSIKQQTQYKAITNYNDYPYIVNIKNFTDKTTNEIKYRSVDIFIFNYKTNKDAVYYCLRLSTKSSSKESFVVEALPVKEGFINKLKEKIKNI